MTSTIRIASAHDLLALVPVLAGYHPERSLVCLAFREDRVVGVLRYDLPRCTADREPLTNAAVGVLCRIPGVDGVVVVTYSDARFRSRAAGGERALLRLLMRRARQAGFAIRDALRVATDGWGSLLDADEPATGRPLELIEASRVTQHPAIVEHVPGAIHDCAALPEVGDEEVERVRSAVSLLNADHGVEVDGDPRTVAGRRPRALAPGIGLADPVDLVETLLVRPPHPEPTNGDVARLAWLARLASMPVYRDAMMLQFAFGPGVGRAALAWEATDPGRSELLDGASEFDRPVASTAHREPDEDGGSDQDCFGHDSPARILLGETPERPDVARVEAGLAVILRSAASAPDRERAGLLCMASWLVWGLGRGSTAATLLEASLDADPDHSMARLLARYFATGALPEWAFQRSAGASVERMISGPRAGR